MRLRNLLLITLVIVFLIIPNIPIVDSSWINLRSGKIVSESSILGFIYINKINSSHEDVFSQYGNSEAESSWVQTVEVKRSALSTQRTEFASRKAVIALDKLKILSSLHAENPEFDEMARDVLAAISRRDFEAANRIVDQM